ncbi:hypothetical protein VMT65_00850 [Nocardia sp. CDC153]|uniref:hypothetical protein n=1 Tax=Nocardia sp. CDC153 TaxID=3112167 RepID=UPI002DBD4012|nr:hypothetical protein [Nocardia sp. CDC153]MEC3951571.1 hypothetical protein [Nocardia sp. CDC153]
MIDRIDEVPEADYVEQTLPANPADDAESETRDAELASVPADDNGWTASEADLVEQAIPVPMDDDHEDIGEQY